MRGHHENTRPFVYLPRRGALALAVLDRLASGSSPWTAHGLAHELQVSTRRIELVMQLLKQTGLVDSQLGPRGGYTLSGDCGERPLLGMIERLFEHTTDAVVPCLTAFAAMLDVAARKCLAGATFATLLEQRS